MLFSLPILYCQSLDNVKNLRLCAIVCSQNNSLIIYFKKNIRKYNQNVSLLNGADTRQVYRVFSFSYRYKNAMLKHKTHRRSNLT